MKVNSHNEWDKLREVIVGTAAPGSRLGFSTSKPVTENAIQQLERWSGEVYPQWLIDEVNEDLEGLCSVLKQFGTKIHRPDNKNLGQIFSTPYWSATGDDAYNMRDLHLVLGNTVIESASQEKHRYFESRGLYKIWSDYLQEGFRWIAAPRPELSSQYMITYHEDGQRHQKLTEDEIIFEAANVVRMGKDLLYLVSRSGNHLAATWLQNVLGDEYKVHVSEGIYRASHIDSTFVCLGPGLVLMSGARVNPKNCPKLFEKWDKIYFNDIAATPPSTLDFHENVRKRVHGECQDLGIDTDLDHLASDWIGMNVLSLDPETVVVCDRQTALMKILEKHNLTPIPVRFRHTHLLRGGLHCCTLDTVRDSKLESYFD